MHSVSHCDVVHCVVFIVSVHGMNQSGSLLIICTASCQRCRPLKWAAGSTVFTSKQDSTVWPRPVPAVRWSTTGSGVTAAQLVAATGDQEPLRGEWAEECKCATTTTTTTTTTNRGNKRTEVIFSRITVPSCFTLCLSLCPFHPTLQLGLVSLPALLLCCSPTETSGYRKPTIGEKVAHVCVNWQRDFEVRRSNVKDTSPHNGH